MTIPNTLDLANLPAVVLACQPGRGDYLGDALFFFDLYEAVERPSVEALSLYTKLCRLVRDNLSEEEMAVAHRYKFAPVIHYPDSRELPEPSDEWRQQAMRLCSQQALLLSPKGAHVSTRWVYRQGDVYGVSVVVGK